MESISQVAKTVFEEMTYAKSNNEHLPKWFCDVTNGLTLDGIEEYILSQGCKSITTLHSHMAGDIKSRYWKPIVTGYYALNRISTINDNCCLLEVRYSIDSSRLSYITNKKKFVEGMLIKELIIKH